MKSRSLLLLIGLAALAACTPNARDVASVETWYRVCVNGCTTFDIGLSRDGSAFLRSPDGKTMPVRVSPRIAREMFGAPPIAATINCPARHDASSIDDNLFVRITLRDGHQYFCEETATGPTFGRSDEIMVRDYVTVVGYSAYWDALASRRTAIDRAIRRNGLERVRLERTACFGQCPAYTVDFRRTGAQIVEYKNGCVIRSRADVPLERVRYALLAANASFLEPQYPLRAIDTPGATITIVTSEGTYAASGGDATSWGPIFASAVQRLDQIVVDAAWSPPLPKRAFRFERPIAHRSC